MKILLSNRGNPDFRQDHSRPLPGTPADYWVEVPDFETASKICRDYIAAHDLGGGNWSGGQINYENSDGRWAFAHVAYNGRVWAGSARYWTGHTALLWPKTPPLVAPPTNVARES